METIYKTPRLHLARSGCVAFSHYSQVADMASLEASEAAFKKIAKEQGRLVTITWMSGGTVTAKVPDDVKEKAAALLRTVEGPLVANVMIISGTGIGVTILRSFMTGFFIVSKIKRPQKAVGDVDAALAYVRSLDKTVLGSLTADETDKHFGPSSLGAAATNPA